MRATNAAEAALGEFGVTSEEYVGRALIDLEPALREDLYGGRLYTMDAQVRPERLVAALERLVRRRGASIDEDCHVRSFEIGRAGIEGVATSKGVFRAAHYVLAAGVRTRRVARRLGLRLRIEPGKGYSVTVDSPGAGPKHACILHEPSVGVTPWAGGYRLGGTMEFAGEDTSLDRTRLSAIISGAADYLRDVTSNLEATQVWAGLRPMTPDELPYIGRAPRHPNLVVAAGHGMMGVSMAPATGLLVAETLTGTEPHIDLTPYRVDRN